jgi:hypothetical protein
MKTTVTTTNNRYLLEKIDISIDDIPRSNFIKRLSELALYAENEKKTIPVDNSFDAKGQQVSIANGVDLEW